MRRRLVRLPDGHTKCCGWCTPTAPCASSTRQLSATLLICCRLVLHLLMTSTLGLAHGPRPLIGVAAPGPRRRPAAHRRPRSFRRSATVCMWVVADHACERWRRWWVWHLSQVVRCLVVAKYSGKAQWSKSTTVYVHLNDESARLHSWRLHTSAIRCRPKTSPLRSCVGSELQQLPLLLCPRLFPQMRVKFHGW